MVDIYRQHLKAFFKCTGAALAAMSLVFAVAARSEAEAAIEAPGQNPFPFQKTAFHLYRSDADLCRLYPEQTVTLQGDSLLKDLPAVIEKAYDIRINDVYYDLKTLTVDLAGGEAERLGRGSAGAAYSMARLYKSLLDIEGVESVRMLSDGKEGFESDHLSFKEPARLGPDGLCPGERYFIATTVSKKLKNDALRLADAIFAAAEDGRVITCGVPAGDFNMGTVRSLLEGMDKRGDAPSENGGYETYDGLGLSFGYNMKERIFEIVCLDREALSAVIPALLNEKAGLLRREQNPGGGLTLVYEINGEFLLYFAFSSREGAWALDSYSVLCRAAAADVIRSGGA